MHSVGGWLGLPNGHYLCSASRPVGWATDVALGELWDPELGVRGSHGKAQVQPHS